MEWIPFVGQPDRQMDGRMVRLHSENMSPLREVSNLLHLFICFLFIYLKEGTREWLTSFYLFLNYHYNEQMGERGGCAGGGG